MKKIKLTPKEIQRADVTDNGRKYTVVSRPQPSGKYFVAIVWVDSGGVYDSAEVYSKSDVAPEIKSMLRMMDKMGAGGGMADKSRHRVK